MAIATAFGLEAKGLAPGRPDLLHPAGLIARVLPMGLLVLLPLVYVAGRRLAELAVGERALAGLLAVPCALTIWLLSVHLLGLWTHHYYVGLFAGTGFAAALGAFSLWRPAPALVEGEPLGRGVWIAAVIAVAALSGIEARYFVWDESIATGHLSMPLEMLNGIYPPRHLSFAQFELRYHYAFDLLTASTSALLGQPEQWKVVHGVALALFGLTAALLWGLGERCLARGAGPFTSAIVLLAGGLPIDCHPVSGKALYEVCPSMPGLGSNFLQHPWSLGMPVGFAAMLIFSVRRVRARWWWAALALTLTLLSFSQIVLFGALMFAVPVAGVLTLREGSKLWQRVLWFGALGVVVLGGAFLCHCFFARVAEPAGLGLKYRPFWHEQKGYYLWIVESVGAALFLGPIGLRYMRHEKLLIAAGAAFGLGVYGMFNYPNSWDVVKFMMLAQVFLAIPMSAAFFHWLRGPAYQRWPAELAVVICLSLGIQFYALGGFGDRTDKFPGSVADFARPEDRDVARWLRRRIGAGESVLRTDRAEAYAIRAGLPVLHLDGFASSFGFSHAAWDARQSLIDHPAAEPDPYLALNVDWFVLGPKDKALQINMDRWVAAGRAAEVYASGELRVFHLY